MSLIEIYKKDNVLQWGTYHYCGKDKTNWCDFAKETFLRAKKLGLLKNDIQVNPISTEEYPTLAKRPQNSMLNCEKIKNTFKIDMPNWHDGLNEVLIKLK